MLPSYIATVLSSMCMDYIRLACLYRLHSTHHKGHYCKCLSSCVELKGVWPCKSVELHIVVSASI